MTATKVYYDPYQRSVIVEAAKEFSPGAGALLASADVNSVDKLIITYPELMGQDAITKQLLGPIVYSDILDINGGQAGLTRQDTIDYLNNQFVENGQGTQKPSITNTLTLDAIIGEHFSLQITADYNPTWFDLSSIGLFYIDHETGVIRGEIQAGLQDITVTAGNSLGADSKNISINGIASGGWTNTYSTRFRRIRQQVVDFGNASALYFKKDEPFTISAWYREGSGGIVNRTSPDLSGYSLSQRTNRVIDFEIVGGLGTAISVSGPQISNKAFTHILITYDGSEDASGIKIYYGSVSQSLTINQNDISGELQATANFIMGETIAQGFCNGHIDEFAVYNKELNQSEVNTIYNAGSPNDLTVNGPVANLVGYWTMGDNDIFPVLSDKSASGNDGQMINMSISSITNTVP